MKKYAITKTYGLFILFVLTLCLENTMAQSCSAGGPETKTISYPFSTKNLNDLFSGGTNCNTTSWSLKSGPIGPRGPRIPLLLANDDVDFPNTGGGQDYEYVYEFTVTDGVFQETANKTCFIDLIEERSSEEQIIYICPGEVIADENELLNAFSLDQVRDTDNTWYQDVNYVGTNFIDEANYYLDNETPITFAPNGIGAGNYIQYGFSANRLKATVQQIGCSIPTDNILFSFANAQNTNDGTNDFFEVDVMVKTTGNSFKLGSGQLFFNYNASAFGEYVNAYKKIWITHPDSEGYIAGQPIDSDPDTPMYSGFRIFDNTQDSADSWFSWSFTQNSSGSNIEADNVTSSASKLCHIKIKYENNTEDPQLSLELENFKNKFTTACGWDTNGDSSNCNLEERLLLTNTDTFSNAEFENLEGISLYPNPAKDMFFVEGNISELNEIEIYSVTGKQIMALNNDFESINISQLLAGMYFVKLISENASKTVKIIKN